MPWGRERGIKPGCRVFLPRDPQSLALTQTGGTHDVWCVRVRPETGRLLSCCSSVLAFCCDLGARSLPPKPQGQMGGLRPVSQRENVACHCHRQENKRREGPHTHMHTRAHTCTHTCLRGSLLLVPNP